MQRWEAGKTVPHGRHQALLAEALELSVEELASLFRDDEHVHQTTRRDLLTNSLGAATALLAHGASAALGLAPPDAWAAPDSPPGTPVPRRLHATDVHHLEHLVRTFHGIDSQFGGGSCREAVVAQTRWAVQLLTVPASADVARRLHYVLADLHGLAGWTSFDLGLHHDAHHHFREAITHSQHAGSSERLASALHRAGRLHLHIHQNREALRFFQLGEIAAKTDPLGTAMMLTNQAWAHAAMGETTPALRSLERARDELGRAGRPTASWAFGPDDFRTISGLTCLELAKVSTGAQRRAHLETARDGLESIFVAREQDETVARSRAFDAIGLTLTCLREGEVDDALSYGEQAGALATQVQSTRVWDRMTPVLAEAQASSSREVRGLAQHLTELMYA